MKIYCGDRSTLPSGYNRFGTRNECLKCGYGSSMYKYRWAPADNSPMPPRRARQGCLRPRHRGGTVRGNQFTTSNRDINNQAIIDRTRLIIAISIWVLASIMTFVLMYTFPPSIVMKVENDKKIINWGKFIALYTAIVMSITIPIIGTYYLTR